MARITTSKTKLSRRVSRNLFLKGSRSFSAKDDYTKKPFKTTIQGKRKPTSLSQYGKQLVEKQALKYTYGLTEKPLANVFKKAFRKTGDTGLIALSILEKRLDNVVYRAGLANSRSQARQLVNHGHFLVNAKPVKTPSYVVKVGDVVTVKSNKLSKNFWKEFSLMVPNDIPNWMDTSKKHTIKIINEPIPQDLPQDFNLAYIVEFYSRKVS